MGQGNNPHRQKGGFADLKKKNKAEIFRFNFCLARVRHDRNCSRDRETEINTQRFKKSWIL